MNLQEAGTLLLSLNGITQERHTTKTQAFDRWVFAGHVVAWHRLLSKKDSAVSGVTGDVLAMHVADLGEKQAWMLAAPQTCFDTPHFAGYPAVLIDLTNADPQVLLEIADAAVDRSRV